MKIVLYGRMIYLNGKPKIQSNCYPSLQRSTFDLIWLNLDKLNFLINSLFRLFLSSLIIIKFVSKNTNMTFFKRVQFFYQPQQNTAKSLKINNPLSNEEKLSLDSMNLSLATYCVFYLHSVYRKREKLLLIRKWSKPLKRTPTTAI